ncbi:MAG: hypothetical protein H0T53_11320 [Herpetosiphonaceae bacterium]|nr:hypothetical protein [Herpetosiphonaceae bacterium]
MQQVNGTRTTRSRARRVRVLALGGLVAIALGLAGLLGGLDWVGGASQPTIVIQPRLAPSARTPVAFGDVTWRAETVALLDRTRRWDGLPTGDVGRAAQGRLDLYATYYAVRAATQLGEPMPHAEATVRRLQESQGPDGHLSCEIAGQTADGTTTAGDRVGCIFYTVETLALLGAHLPAPAPVIQQLQALQSPAGPFAENEADLAQMLGRAPALETDLLSTWQAVRALATLKAPLVHRESLTAWLGTQWANDPLFDQDPNNLTLIVGVADTLRDLGSDVGTLPGQVQRRHWAESLQAVVVESPALDLFLIQGWLALLHDLGSNDPLRRLHQSGLLARLTAAQEPNGGFTTATGMPGDFQGLALALDLMNMAHHPVPRAETMTALLTRHALPGGGFLGVLHGGSVSPGGVNKTLEINALLGGPPEAPAALQGYATAYLTALQEQAKQEGAGVVALDDLYQTALLADHAGVDRAVITPLITHHALTFLATLDDAPMLTDEHLLQGYLLSQLVHFDAPSAEVISTNLRRAQQVDGSFTVRGQPSLRSTWLALHTLAALAMTLPPEQQATTAAWIKQQRTLGAGYHEVGAEEPDLLATFFAVDSLKLVAPQETIDPDLQRWIAELRLPQGVRIQTQDQQPNLAATLYALRLQLSVPVQSK